MRDNDYDDDHLDYCPHNRKAYDCEDCEEAERKYERFRKAKEFMEYHPGTGLGEAYKAIE